MVRVGGGWDTLEHYLDKHDPCRCKSGKVNDLVNRLLSSKEYLLLKLLLRAFVGLTCLSISQLILRVKKLTLLILERYIDRQLAIAYVYACL